MIMKKEDLLVKLAKPTKYSHLLYIVFGYKTVKDIFIACIASLPLSQCETTPPKKPPIKPSPHSR